jgi:hypothetical protein
MEPAKITIGYYELIARSQLPYEHEGFHSTIRGNILLYIITSFTAKGPYI